MDALPRIAQTSRTCSTLLGDGDPLILATRILQDDGMTILDQTNQPQVVLGHDDRASVGRIRGARPTVLAIGAGLHGDRVTWVCSIYRRLNRLAGMNNERLSEGKRSREQKNDGTAPERLHEFPLARDHHRAEIYL